MARANQNDGPLITNPGFEQMRDGRAEGWAPFEQGYTVVSDVVRGGKSSIRCVNRTADERRGATWTLVLNQKNPVAILVAGWSKAENVGGFPNNDYAIYLDLEHMDGTPLWGQTAPFAVGTHDWQRKQVLVVPSKPVRSVHIHALFRHHVGTVWFDDFTARELSGSDLFDSQPLAPPKLPPGAARGWFARDVAANTPVLPLLLENAGHPASSIRETTRHTQRLRLRLTDLKSEAQGQIVTGTLEDTSGRPRAVTLYYVERFDAPDTVWWNDIRQSAPTGMTGERANLTRVNAGAVGALSLYPFGCVTGGPKGRAVGVPALLGPRIVRIGYHAGAKLLYVAFDVALTPENRINSAGLGYGRVKVGIVRYDVDPAWGFRAAAAAYYALFPDAFDRRAKAEGIWIPFTDPAVVQGAEDFGIAYHEGDNSVASDDQRGILSFRYTEPMSYWMPMPPEMPRTYETALSMIREHVAGKDEQKRKWAQAVLISGSHDENGRFNVEFQNAPWTNGAVWILNPNPRIPHGREEWTKQRLSYTLDMANERYGPNAEGVLDGEYLDSIEGWADVLDFRRESLLYARTPPTFTTDTHRPVIPTWFSVYDLAEFMRADLRQRGKLLMANATPWRLFAFLPLLDVAGTETNWNPGGRWQPDSDALFNLRRTLCYRKPYLLLQNTDFDKFGTELVEKYFQRSMFYGIYPSMFSVDAATNPYWNTPRWYNRDRPLFKKYIPAVKRLSSAGWEPITHARSDQPAVYIERFGRDYLTVLNNSTAASQVTLTVDLSRFWSAERLKNTRQLRVMDVVSGAELVTLPASETVRIALSLKPEEARALQITAAGR